MLSKPHATRLATFIRHQDAGTRLLDIVKAVLLSHAKSQAGSLQMDDIEEVIGAIKKSPGLLVSSLRGIQEIPSALWIPRDPFTRILTSRFAHLLVDPEKRPLSDGYLSRRMLPGFFVAIRLLIGAGLYDQLQDQSLELVRRCRHSPKDMADPGFWSALYDTEDARQIATRVYGRVAMKFSRYDHYKRWLIAIVNSKLEAHDAGAEKHWRFGDAQFLLLWGELYIESANSLRLSSHVSACLSEEYGDSAVVLAHTMAGSLAQDLLAARARQRFEETTGLNHPPYT